jgi:hypothetical protein
MEYVFGEVFRNGAYIENVKTAGTEHSDLKGFYHIEKIYPDMVIVDDFRIKEKYHSAETEELCFDWYEIDGHRRTVDKFSPVKEKIETDINDSQDAICILSEDVEIRLSEIEDALCEISALQE